MLYSYKISTVTVFSKTAYPLFHFLAVVYGVVIIGGAFIVKYFGTLVLQV